MKMKTYSQTDIFTGKPLNRSTVKDGGFTTFNTFYTSYSVRQKCDPLNGDHKFLRMQNKFNIYRYTFD